MPHPDSHPDSRADSDAGSDSGPGPDSSSLDPFERAVALHQSGDVAEAISIYRSLLAAEGEDGVLLELLGTALAATGSLEEALACLDRAVTLEAGDAASTARLQRGMVRESAGDHAGAIEDFHAALDADPTSAGISERLAHALAATGAWQAAAERFASAITLADASARLPLRRGRADALLHLAQFDEARREIDAVLEVEPEDEAALALLVRLHAAGGDATRALATARRAATLHANSTTSRRNLLTALVGTGERPDAEEVLARLRSGEGPPLELRDRRRLDAMAQAVLGRFSEAVATLEAILQADPGDIEALGALAAAQRRSGRVEQAAETIARAVEAEPRDLGLHVELGRIRLALDDAEGAIEAFEEAQRLGGFSAATALELVNALKRRGLVVRATEVAEDGLRRTPEAFDLRASLGMLLHEAGRHREAVGETEAAASRTDASPTAISNHLYGLNNPSGLDEANVVAQHRKLAPAAWPPPTPKRVAVDRDPHDLDAERRLRIGFVSGDLKEHSVAWFLMPLLRGRDASRLEAVCYSNTPREDAVTERLRGASDRWRPILGLGDEEVAESIRADRIDLLIDLSGHTGGNRLGVFRQRPAPVQATWLGYPNTTGIPEIDWRIVDARTDPAGSERHASEALLRIEAPFLCFDREVAAIEIPPRPRRPVVFGSFNNTTKLSERCVALWAGVLGAVPESRLLLKSRAFEDAALRGRTLDRFAAVGIAPERLELRGFSQGLAAHHLAYADLDIALDTFPYHGTTTTCEAIWNGTPVVSRIGEHHRSRVGGTILAAVGLSELACGSDEAFVAAAASLAADHERLRELHLALRERTRASELCDAEGFAARFERGVRVAWRCRCRGDTPQSVLLEG